MGRFESCLLLAVVAVVVVDRGRGESVVVLPRAMPHLLLTTTLPVSSVSSSSLPCHVCRYLLASFRSLLSEKSKFCSHWITTTLCGSSMWSPLKVCTACLLASKRRVASLCFCCCCCCSRDMLPVALQQSTTRAKAMYLWHSSLWITISPGSRPSTANFSPSLKSRLTQSKCLRASTTVTIVIFCIVTSRVRALSLSSMMMALVLTWALIRIHRIESVDKQQRRTQTGGLWTSAYF